VSKYVFASIFVSSAYSLTRSSINPTKFLSFRLLNGRTYLPNLSNILRKPFVRSASLYYTSKEEVKLTVSFPSFTMNHPQAVVLALFLCAIGAGVVYWIARKVLRWEYDLEARAQRAKNAAAGTAGVANAV